MIKNKIFYLEPLKQSLKFHPNILSSSSPPPSFLPIPFSNSQSSKNFTFSFKPSEWKTAISEAEKIVGYSTSFLSLRCLLSDELSNVALHMKKLVGTSHPLIKTAQKLFRDGKHSMQTRGLLVLLISKTAGPAIGSTLLDNMISGIYPCQRTLAEITELIHMATLIHKSVIDLCSHFIGGPIEDMEFGNKMAILSGDFLLANASTYLASLNNTKVVELISTAIGDIMKGEFTNLKNIKSTILKNSNTFSNNDHEFVNETNNNTNNTDVNIDKSANIYNEYDDKPSANNTKEHSYECNLEDEIKSEFTIKKWEEQTYLSSGSLLAHSCQGALALAEHDHNLQNQAFKFGRYMALAHQFKEDITKLYNTTSDDDNAIVTAPIIIYANRHLKPNKIVNKDRSDEEDEIKYEYGFKRKEFSDSCKEFFNRPNKEIRKLVLSDKMVMEESKFLCRQYGTSAMESLAPFRDSSAKNALNNMIKAVINV